MSQLIQIENIQVQQKSNRLEDAIRRAGQLLFENGSVDTDYIDMMVQAIHEMGPYIVIAHILHLPMQGQVRVLKRMILVFFLITLESPVPFGSEHNDPVNIVLLSVLQKMAGILSN